jgi:ABC-type branched-subunit amino acid transport system substrate-binding protein
MRGKSVRVIAGTAVLAIAAAACGGGGGSSDNSNSSSPAGGSGSSGALKEVTVGLLTDVTGLAASGNKLSQTGAKAGAVYAERNGYKVKIVVADTQTNPSAVTAAAQKLVTRDHVDAVIAHSALAFSAAPYLTSKGIPVVGVAEDGPEWTTSKNMFSVWGAIHTEKVSTTSGEFFKLVGAKNIGGLGYDISPSSAQAAKGTGVSAEAVGLNAAYINAKFPFGSTNVQPIALAMKNADVDGLATATDPNTAYALVGALKNIGHTPKAVVLASGYGVDTLQAGPGALQNAQNVYYTTVWQPVEMNTPATQKFQADLKQAGFTDVPSLAIYGGYLSVVLLVRGWKDAGSTDKAAVITALSNVHDWDSAGLFPEGKTMDINDRENIITGADNCEFATKLVGTKFELVKGADPICGKDTGKTVSAK